MCDAVWCAEFALVRSAVYTEPQDQSAWLYHRWLLSRVLAAAPAIPSLLIALGHHDRSSPANTLDSPSHPSPSSPPHPSLAPSAVAVFSRELSMCRELDALEPNCKWTLLTMGLLVAGVEALRRREGDVGGVESMDGEVVEELRLLFERLVELDPLRTAYYRDVHRSLTSSAAAAIRQPEG